VERQLVCSPRVIWEQSFCFDPEVLQLHDNIYLVGYWQSERYFADIREVLLQEFTVASPLSGRNRALADAITGCNAVSMHIRRGDYVSNATTAAFHGVCDLDYYESAIEQIDTFVDQPHIFVFSDDHAWTRQHLHLQGKVTYVDHNDPDQGHEDMRLMSLCKHNIIANSTFSWWGAWLNRNPNKTVIAPRCWFADASIDTSDLIPSSWIRL
jgi:hypothetical protein